MNKTLFDHGGRLLAPAYFPTPSRRLLALGTQGCRWPLGELDAGSFAFCGLRCLGRDSYCALHRRRARESAPLCEALR